jgi:hypothetical protein
MAAKCVSGKASYPGKNAAFGGAIRASRKTGKGMRAYKCHKCPSWHLTTKPKREN